MVDMSTDEQASSTEESRGLGVRSLMRGSVVGFSLATAACIVVILAVVLLLIVQPGKKPAPTCWDSAMQMEMPCTSAH